MSRAETLFNPHMEIVKRPKPNEIRASVRADAANLMPRFLKALKPTKGLKGIGHIVIKD